MRRFFQQSLRQRRYHLDHYAGRFLFKQRCYHELSFSVPGEPNEVITFKHNDDILDEEPRRNVNAENGGNSVRVNMLHVPWNPADVNTVQGKYPSPYLAGKQPNTKSLHFNDCRIVGSEGWGRVTSSMSTNLPEGSLVTFAKPGLGTVRSFFWVDEDDLLHIPEEVYTLYGPAGCTLFQLGGTAIRMLKDFVSLRPGDVIIQNAGNSGVSLMVSQLASILFGIPVVSLVRRGSKSKAEFEELVDYLVTKGKNALVVAEEDLQDREYLKSVQKQIQDLSKNGEMPPLALNSVGGDSAKSLLRLIGLGGTLVTYGGMSGKPVIVGTPQLIFKDVKTCGYWHSRWMAQHSREEKQEMIDELVRAVVDMGVECPPVRVFPLHDFQEGLLWQSNQGSIRSKLVWDCQES